MKNLEKISLVTVEGKLSRTEMKNIMAGSAFMCCEGTTCSSCYFVDSRRPLPVCSRGTITAC